MTMFRMPIFVWNTLVTSLLVLIAFPILAGALLSLEADRLLGAHVFDTAHGGAILWQHLFWFFGHPEVYIIALPFFGIITEILPVFSRKPIFGYVGLVGATLGIAILSVAVWAHHMFVTGAVDLPFFSGMTFLIAVPTGVKFFNWIGTMWGGSLSFDTPMLWSVGFLTTFLFGGLTGIILASPPLDFHVSDSYFVVAHFHYVVFGTVVFAMFAGFYFWWPKMTGRMLDERLGKRALLAAVRRLPHDVPGPALAGRRGHAASLRRLPAPGRLHHAQPGLHDRRVPARRLDAAVPLQRLHLAAGRRWSSVDDPWGWGRSLEWATSCPPPRHNFDDDPADPLGVAGLRPAPPGGRRDRAGRERRRARRPTRRRARHGRPRGDAAADRRGTATTPTRRTTTDEGRGLDLRDLPRSSSCWSRPAYWFITGDWTGTSALTMTTLLAAHGDALPRLPRRRGWTRAPRTARTPRSPTAPASWASSRRTPGGRCGAALTLAVCVFGVAMGAWWLFIIGVVPRRAGALRLDLRVLPRRARPLSAPRRPRRRGRLTSVTVASNRSSSRARVTLERRPRTVPRGVPSSMSAAPCPRRARAPPSRASWRRRSSAAARRPAADVRRRAAAPTGAQGSSPSAEPQLGRARVPPVDADDQRQARRTGRPGRHRLIR